MHLHDDPAQGSNSQGDPAVATADTATPCQVTRLLTATGDDFRAALLAASVEQLAAARWRLDGCGPSQVRRQAAVISAHEAAERRIPPPGPYLTNWLSQEFTATEDLPRIRARQRRATPMRHFHAVALAAPRGGLVRLDVVAAARELFFDDVRLGIWGRWDPADFARIPEAWARAYMLEAAARVVAPVLGA